MTMRSLALCCCFALAGCYSGPGTEDRSDGKDTSLLPLGVLSPSSDGSGATTGIFPGSSPDDPYCCWLGRSASFEVRVPAHAHSLFLTVFVPDLKPFHEHAQGLAISVDQARVQRFEHLPIGAKILSIPLPPSPNSHVSDVVVDAAFSFSPKKAKVTGDTRQLAIYLKAVSAR